MAKLVVSTLLMCLYSLCLLLLEGKSLILLKPALYILHTTHYTLPTSAVNKLGNMRTADTIVRCVNRGLFTNDEKKLFIYEFKYLNSVYLKEEH